jgi:hypothetical protein
MKFVSFFDANIATYLTPRNRSSERRIKVSKEIEQIKKEMMHKIDDLNISIYAGLDRIYKEIVRIKKVK